ncbi:MAG: 2,3-bisphosphoglycerate-independent phosphoglycerate mutase [Thermostichales cyanobacterium HHBFW_bins_127]
MVAPVVLVILDGWGHREDPNGNAILAAQAPVMRSLWQAYPHTLLNASGRAVGLPAGQMGNSEVGHLTLGSGRIVPQELVRISDAAETGSLAREPVLVNLLQTLKTSGKALHLIGLCSEGGVHSHIDHLYALLDIAQDWGIPTYIHVITDGRDTPPRQAIHTLAALEAKVRQSQHGVIATLGGRYYAMDRDRRWDRTQKMYQVMTEDGPGTGQRLTAAIAAAYAQDINDEFIVPVRLAPGAVQAGDGVVFFNFRPDRARQLTQAFVQPDFSGFERQPIADLHFVTMTQYGPDLPVQVIFPPQNLDQLLGQVVSEHGLKQLRLAETEKYAHVTYFFNGGIEVPFPGEERILVPSPLVSTYDQAPAMAAPEVTEQALQAIAKQEYALIVMNYANPDMVGHTGNYQAAIQAIEAVDRCIGQVVAAVSQVGGTTLIVADHGNAEMMWDENGNPWTAHTTNLVPCILVEGEKRKLPGHGGMPELRIGGSLADVAPTILQLLGLPQPECMTGRSLIPPPAYDITEDLPTAIPVGV